MRKLAYGAFGSAAAAALLLGSAGIAAAGGASAEGVTAGSPGIAAAGGASAEGVTAGSPGVLSGNQLQVPVHVPINLCGNTVDIIGLLNPAFGNSCLNA
ncbi:chaplin [Kitasatospora sp. NBC_00374]|uniref:chaplin n=1 Tax=Kitasatospora sp. NBC_00374 TaxID=2975964 RepID=UPI0030E45BCD